MNPFDIIFSRLFAWFRQGRFPFPLTNAWVIASTSLAFLFWNVALVGIWIRGNAVTVPTWVFLVPYLAVVGLSWFHFLGSGRYRSIFEDAKKRKEQGLTTRDNLLTVTWLLLSFGAAVALGIHLTKIGLWIPG